MPLDKKRNNMNALKAGTTLQNGKYTISQVLGAGTFGITYMANTRVQMNGPLGQMDVTVDVAVKEFYMKDINVRTSDGANIEGTQNTLVKDYRHKFRKEAENLAKLHHKNIVQVVDVFDENNTTYYVMKHIDGNTLDQYILSKGRLKEHEALTSISTVGEALAYMHSHNIIHLDLKPKNIMRDKAGNLLLIDFGLSKQYDEKGEPESSTSIGLGTPGYAPIEQANFKQDGTIPVTLDIYALGATLFKMLTGQTPPEASTILNDGFPTLLLQQAGVSAATIAVVEKAMSPMRKQRFQSMNEMLQAIAAINGSVASEDTVLEDEDTDYEQPATHAQPVNNAQPIDVVEPEEEAEEPEEDDDENDEVEDERFSYKKIAIWLAAICIALVVVFYVAYNKSTPSAQTEAVTNAEPTFTQEIDLGLPSGTIWAGWNIGATKAEDPGGLYAWGETETHKTFTHYFDDSYSKYTLAKGKTALIGSDDDVAHATWGNGWRMPSRKEVDELITHCTFERTTYKGCKGLMGTGPNGNKIFFPCTGYGNENGVWDRKTEGDYLCGELCALDTHDHSAYDPSVLDALKQSKRAVSYQFRSDQQFPTIGCGPRVLGRAVRAVK